MVTTGGRQLEPVATVKHTAGSGRRAEPRPYAYSHRVGGGHFYGLTSKVETATHRAGSSDCLFNRDGISATHRPRCGRNATPAALADRPVRPSLARCPRIQH